MKNSIKEGSYNGDGVYLFNLPSNKHHVIENCEIFNNEGCGLRIRRTRQSLKIFNNYIHDNLIQNLVGYTNWGGINFGNSFEV